MIRSYYIVLIFMDCIIVCNLNYNIYIMALLRVCLHSIDQLRQIQCHQTSLGDDSSDRDLATSVALPMTILFNLRHHDYIRRIVGSRPLSSGYFPWLSVVQTTIIRLLSISVRLLIQFNGKVTVKSLYLEYLFSFYIQLRIIPLNDSSYLRRTGVIFLFVIQSSIAYPIVLYSAVLYRE